MSINCVYLELYTAGLLGRKVTVNPFIISSPQPKMGLGVSVSGKLWVPIELSGPIQFCCCGTWLIFHQIPVSGSISENVLAQESSFPQLDFLSDGLGKVNISKGLRTLKGKSHVSSQSLSKLMFGFIKANGS